MIDLYSMPSLDSMSLLGFMSAYLFSLHLQIWIDIGIGGWQGGFLLVASDTVRTRRYPTKRFHSGKENHTIALSEQASQHPRTCSLAIPSSGSAEFSRESKHYKSNNSNHSLHLHES